MMKKKAKGERMIRNNNRMVQIINKTAPVKRTKEATRAKTTAPKVPTRISFQSSLAPAATCSTDKLVSCPTLLAVNQFVLKTLIFLKRAVVISGAPVNVVSPSGDFMGDVVPWAALR